MSVTGYLTIGDGYTVTKKQGFGNPGQMRNMGGANPAAANWAGHTPGQTQRQVAAAHAANISQNNTHQYQQVGNGLGYATQETPAPKESTGEAPQPAPASEPKAKEEVKEEKAPVDEAAAYQQAYEMMRGIVDKLVALQKEFKEVQSTYANALSKRNLCYRAGGAICTALNTTKWHKELKASRVRRREIKAEYDRVSTDYDSYLNNVVPAELRGKIKKAQPKPRL